MLRYTMRAITGVCLCALVVAAIVGCSSPGTAGVTGSSGGTAGGGGSSGNSGNGSGGNPGGGMMGNGGSGATKYSSDGQRVYLSGVGIDGQNIPRSAPRVSQGSLMMGGGGCGSCHGANGRGGTIRMMTGATVKAPDITYDALIKAGFTEAKIRGAIRDGLDEAGKRLKVAMPRWQMSDADLDATIAYLKVLSAK